MYILDKTRYSIIFSVINFVSCLKIAIPYLIFLIKTDRIINSNVTMHTLHSACKIRESNASMTEDN